MAEAEKFALKRKRGIRRKARARNWFVYTLYLVPSLAGVLLFFFGPMVAKTLIPSFQRSPMSEWWNPEEYVGFKHYISTLTNDAFLDAAKNTLIFSALAVPLAVLLALLLALLLDVKIPARSWFRSVFLSPMMVPVASVVLIWQVVFSHNGALNTFLANFGVDKLDWMKSDWSRLVILLLFLWKNLGYNMVLFLSALGTVPKDLLESARMDGGSGIRCFFSIKLAYLYPTIFFVSIMSLINSFKVFREVYLLTGDYPYDSLYMLQHFMNNAFRRLEYQQLTSAAIIMAVAMIIIVGGLFIAENRLGKDVEE